MNPAPIKTTARSVPECGNAIRGETSLILGCMFSGKTTELIRRVAEYSGEGVLAIKHSIDTRFDRDAIVSHAGKSLSAIPVRSARDILELINEQTRVVAVDEGHFFDLALVDVVAELNERTVNVVMTSLEPDSWGRPFPINETLRERVAVCVMMTANCARCGDVADRTQRLTPIVAGNMVVDPSQYEPRCRSCWRAPVPA